MPQKMGGLFADLIADLKRREDLRKEREAAQKAEDLGMDDADFLAVAKHILGE